MSRRYLRLLGAVRRCVYPTSFWTARGLAVRAVALVLVFLGLHALGFREYVSVFSGTSPTGEWGVLPVALGASYAVAYLAAVVVAPIFGLAALLLRAVFAHRNRLSRRRGGKAGERCDPGQATTVRAKPSRQSE